MSQAGRIGEARALLAALGMDDERGNERSALALLHLGPGEDWSRAGNPMLGTRAIMDWIRDHYGRAYAPNTRETIRRQTLHPTPCCPRRVGGRPMSETDLVTHPFPPSRTLSNSTRASCP